MNKKVKTLAVALALSVLPFAGCGKKDKQDLMEDVVNRTDFTSVYERIGKQVTIDMVTEKEGLAYVTVVGK